MRDRTVERRHHAHGVGAVTGEHESFAEPALDVQRAELRLHGALADRDEAHVRDFGDDDLGGREQIGISLGAAKVRDRPDDDLVGPDAELGAYVIARARRGGEHRVDVDAVSEHSHASAAPWVASSPGPRRNRDGEIVPADGQRLAATSQRLVTRPDVVLGGHEPGPVSPRQGADDEAGARRGERRMDVHDIDRFRTQLHPQASHPAEIPRAGVRRGRSPRHRGRPAHRPGRPCGAAGSRRRYVVSPLAFRALETRSCSAPPLPRPLISHRTRRGRAGAGLGFAVESLGTTAMGLVVLPVGSHGSAAVRCPIAGRSQRARSRKT